MTENQLLREVMKLCGRHDVELDHRYQPVQDRAGWPDCSLLGTSAAAFRELKTATGRLSLAQRRTGERMRVAGLDFDVWRPEDLESGRIEAEIAALSGKRSWKQPAR